MPYQSPLSNLIHLALGALTLSLCACATSAGDADQAQARAPADTQTGSNLPRRDRKNGVVEVDPNAVGDAMRGTSRNAGK